MILGPTRSLSGRRLTIQNLHKPLHHFPSNIGCIRPPWTDFRPSVHLRPHFQIFNGPSSKSVHELNGPCSSAVHHRPSMTNNHGPLSESVHLKIIILVQCPNLSMDGLSPNFGPFSTWTGGRMNGPQTAVFVQGGVSYKS